MPLLVTSELVKVKVIARHVFRFEYDSDQCKLNGFCEEIRKRMSLNAEANIPSVVVLNFRPKVSIVVHRKRAI